VFRNLIRALTANAYLLLTLTALFWAGNFVLARGVHGHVPPVALAWSRWVLAFLIVLPFAIPHLRRDWRAICEKPLLITMLAITGVGIFNTLSYIALNYATAISGAVIYSVGPALIAITSFIVFAERLSWRQVLGIAISLLGVLVVVMQGEVVALFALKFNSGDLLFLAATVIWAIYTVYLRNVPEMHWLSFIAVTFFIGALVITPFFVAEHYSGWRLQFDRTTALAILYVSIFPSVIAYSFYNRAVELIGANRAGVFLYVVPVFSTLLAIALLGEKLEVHHVVGFALIFAGVTLASRKPKALPADASS
jgi:drug/metabolite transporter (DMT)-like permease